MGTYHSTDKEKRNGTISHYEPKLKRQVSIAVDVNVSPPTLKRSKRQNKKRLERSKRIDYFELQNEVAKEHPVDIPTEMEKTRSLGIRNDPLGGANGSTDCQPQKMTLLQHAELPKSERSENIIFAEESEKKNIALQESLNKNDKLRACENKAIHLIRVFPSLPDKPGDGFDIKKSDQIIQDKNINFENNIVEKNELDEHVESSVSCGNVAIGGRFVTFNDDDGKDLELTTFKYDLERERLRSDKIRPVSLPIAISQKDTSRCSMSKTLERPDINLKEQRDVKRTIFFNDVTKNLDDINGGIRRNSKESWICTLRSQKSSTINKALQGLKVTPLDSKLYLPDSLEMGISKKREMYKVNEMVEMLSKPGALINLVGCHGSGKSEILSVLGLQFVKSKEIACLTVDCHGCDDERSVLQCLLRTFNLNFNPIPDDWLGDDNKCHVQCKEILKWLINYISFHGQIQLIILMVDGLSIDSSLGRSCVKEFFIPLLERCISCLSILLSSSSNYLDVSEEDLALNGQTIKASNGLPAIDLLDANDIQVSFDVNKEDMENGHDAQLTHIRSFKLQSSPYLPACNAFGGSLFNDSSIVSENNGALAEIVSKYRLTLQSCKVLINAAEVKPGSLHNLIQKAESCTHPSLIVLENELVTRLEKFKSSTQDRTAVDTDENNKQFQDEIMNASVIIAALETLDDKDQTLASLMWLMSDFRLGFDLESVTWIMSTRKFLENDLDWRMNLSAKLETVSCGILKESHEERSKILNAITKLVKLGFLQIVKSPVTFSSPLSSRRGSLIDPVAKPSRLLDKKLNSFTIDRFKVSSDKLFPRYRIPNAIRPVVRHLRPEFFGRPNFVLDHMMAKKLVTFYQAFYSNESFSSVLNELDMIYSDFIRCLERNVVVEQGSDVIKSPTEFKACLPMMHACHLLTTLPGAIFLAQILPLSTYMKIFFGISNTMQQKAGTKDNTLKDSSLEYRALMCIILRHKMSASQNKTFANDLFISGMNSMKTKVDKTRLDAHSSSSSSSPAAGSSHEEVDDPTNLFNSIKGISGLSQLHETSLTDMISRIKCLLFQVNKADRAFFYYIMGIHLWQGDQDQALTLMKKSLDLFKESNLDQGDEILPNFGQVCIQIVSETYSWMLFSTHRTQAARHMYNLVDSTPSSSSSTSLVSPPTISQNILPTPSSTSSSYYSLHSHYGLSPSSCTSRNEEDGNGCIVDKQVDVCSVGDSANVSAEGNGKNCGQASLKGPSLTNNDIRKSIEDKDDFEQEMGNNESLAILTHCRNTLKSMSDFNSHNSKNVISRTSRNDALTLDKHPLKLRGLECRRKIWSELGLLARARDTAKSFVELSQQWWGQDHPSTSGALMGQCLVAEKLGRNNEAVETCVQALLLRLKFFGDKHHSSVESCVVLSRLLLKCSMYEESLELAKRALNMTTFLMPQREDHVLEAEKIIGTADKKLKSEKPKREVAVSIPKSVTFHTENVLIGSCEDGDTEKSKQKKAQDAMICSSAICKFDPELAQTFHRCFQVSVA